MAHRYPNVLIHCVFSTKTRLNLIPDALLLRLFSYLNGIGRNIKVPVIAAGGTANHVHMLIALPPDITVAKAMQAFKANSSRWIGEHGIKFAWQEGYGAFGVSTSLRNTVRNYIEQQAQHHQKRSFEEEFAALLSKCGIDFDPATLFAD